MLVHIRYFLARYYKMNFLDAGSLTKKLQSLAKKKFEVKVIQEGFVYCAPQQLPLLALDRKQALWRREVELCVDGQVYVRAETYIPLRSLCGDGRQFFFLNTRPLGKILFRDPHVKRSPFSVVGNTRSSVIHYHGLPLLICETFTEKCLHLSEV